MPYRQDYTMDYRRRLQMALDAQRQRAAVTGRPLAPQEVGEITEAAIGPYAQAYGQDYLNAMRMQQQQRNWDKMYNLRQRALKQEEKAANVAAIAEFAKLGLGAGSLAARYRRPGTTAQPQPVGTAQAPPPSAWETGNYGDKDPQMYGVAPSVVQPYSTSEDPTLMELSPHDQQLWDIRGAELGYDRAWGTADPVWRRYDQWNQQYYRERAIEEQRRKRNFLMQRGI